KLAPSRPRTSGHKQHFAIVASLFNRPYVQGLVDHAVAELRALSPAADISIHQVPGAFEIPVVVREIALKKNTQAILALGVILQGKTARSAAGSRAISFLARPAWRWRARKNGRILGVLPGSTAGPPICSALNRWNDRAPAGDRRPHPEILRELRFPPHLGGGSKRF